MKNYYNEINDFSSFLHLFLFPNIIRELTAQVVNIDGVNILTTPTETSVWKGHLEKDKVQIRY